MAKLELGKKIYVIGELRELIAHLDDKDQICIEGLDTDLYPMYVDIIEGIKLTDGSIVREVRFCQIPNTIDDLPVEQPDTEDVISTTEFDDFVETWGQTHEGICAELSYDPKTSDDLLMVDYFWIEGEKQWFPKLSSMYTEREQFIADYLRTAEDCTYELCPHCENEVKLRNEFRVQQCPSCRCAILPCSICTHGSDAEHTKPCDCSTCPLENK